jgi:transcription elongation factor Elf1
MRLSASHRNCDKMGDWPMKFMCPHCGGSEYRLLEGADGRIAAECLNCGRASTFEQSMLPELTETAEQAASET